MGKISWEQKRKTKDVLKDLETEKTPLNTIQARNLKILGHTKRHDSILKKSS